MKFVAWIGRDGERYTQDGCGCDMDDPCSDVKCVMDREREMAYMLRLYNRERTLSQWYGDPADTDPLLRGTDEEVNAMVLRDAGRGHLVHETYNF